MAKSTEIVPAMKDEELVVQDVLGNRRAYTLAQITERLMPAGASLVDIQAFMLYARMTGANPFAKEVYPVPFKEKDKQGKYGLRVAAIPAVAFLRRLAADSDDFDGLVLYPVDDKEAPLSKTGDPTKVKGAVCEVWLKSQRLPTREVVALEEAKGTSQFWTNSAKAVHQLLITAERRALRRAFLPDVGLSPMEEIPAGVEQDAIDAEFQGEDAGEEMAAQEDVEPEELKRLAEEQAAKRKGELTLGGLGKKLKAIGATQKQADQAKEDLEIEAQAPTKPWKELTPAELQQVWDLVMSRQAAPPEDAPEEAEEPEAQPPEPVPPPPPTNHKQLKQVLGGMGFDDDAQDTLKAEAGFGERMWGELGTAALSRIYAEALEAAANGTE